MKLGIVAGVLAVAGCVIAVAVMDRHDPAPKSPEQTTPAADGSQSTESSPPVRPAPSAEKTPSPLTHVESSAPSPPQQTERLAQNRAQKANEAARQPKPADASKRPREKPLERYALSYVGADRTAEAVWLAAINNPDISAHDRSDLIEDLNEEGFPQPNNPTLEDLPLIENRLAIIEQFAPSSMDDVNADAFAEAYKDLTNMRARIMGQ